jgi:hypothetical protein
MRDRRSRRSGSACAQEVFSVFGWSDHIESSVREQLCNPITKDNTVLDITTRDTGANTTPTASARAIRLTTAKGEPSPGEVPANWVPMWKQTTGLEPVSLGFERRKNDCHSAGFSCLARSEIV